MAARPSGATKPRGDVAPPEVEPPLPTPAELAAARGKRVVIFSARFGGGHRSTAEALASWWEQHVPDSPVTVIDYFDEFVSRMTTVAAGIGYTQSVRLFPAGWGLFYEITRNLPSDSAAQHWFNRLGQKDLEGWLRDNPIDLAVAVHPTPAGALSELRISGRLQCPAVTVVTDYTIHNQWIHPGTDMVMVGSRPVRGGYIRRGVSPDKLRVTGIPVRANTALLQQREALREKWELRPGRPTVMVMTGAQGMMRRPWPLFNTVASRPVQGFFLCGKDRSLYTRLKLVAHRYPEFRILPFVRIVPELMCVSDVLVTKAGGLTTSEALAMELPMLIFHPIPGQEYANRDYLVRAGAAIAAEDMTGLGEALDQLCREPKRLLAMREATRRIRRPDAAAHACVEMLRLLREGSTWSGS